MKDLMNKAFSLGLGLAASTREQAEKLAQDIAPGDIIVCLGAGDITKWAAELARDVSEFRATEGA